MSSRDGMTAESDTTRLLRETDWSRTPLGPIDRWPASLRVAVGICMNSRFPMFVWWGDQHINIYNEAYIPVLGKRHPAAFGKPAREFWGEIWPVVGPQAEAVMLHGEATWNERVLLVMERNGYVEDTYFTWSYSPIPDESGKIVGLFCACTEETARLRAEAERDRLAQHRQLALDSAGMAWWHIDPVANRVTWDKRFAEIWDVPDDSRDLAEIIAERLHPADAPAVNAAIAAALNPRDPKPYAIEYRIVRRDGSVRWIDARGTADFAGEGDARVPSNFVGTVADITERKRIEMELRESESRFRHLADAMPQIVWSASEGGVPEYFNRRWYEFTGYTPGDPVHPGYLADVIFADDLDLVRTGWARSIETNAPFECEYRLRRHDGVYRWHLGRSLPIQDAGGQVVRWYGTATDVDDQRQAEMQADQQRRAILQAEQNARAEAERVSMMKDEFLATLSHELRTPLNAMLGWAQILKRDKRLAPDAANGLEVIERNARAQSQIIEDLLDMSRIISGKVRIDVDRVNLAAMVAVAVETARPSAEAKGVNLQQAIDPLDGLVISGDPNRLQQVLWNLVSNAIKFTRRGGNVQVTAGRVESHVELRVVDTGEGISAEFLPHVFDRFRQADASTTRRHGGLGLGLAIVRQLVELHGGSVRAESLGLGMGSSFVVTLPLNAAFSEYDAGGAIDGAARADADGRVEADVDLTGVRVLIVDDEPDARALIERLLDDRGAIVTMAESGQTAIDLLERETFDVLVSDIGMPDLDGYGLMRRVRALPPGRGGAIPAIALTAYARSEDRVRAIAAGFLMHVAKPVEPAELVTMVAGAAGRIGSR